jgi:hypothetical protein
MNRFDLEVDSSTGHESVRALDQRATSRNVDHGHAVAWPHARRNDPVLFDAGTWIGTTV